MPSFSYRTLPDQRQANSQIVRQRGSAVASYSAGRAIGVLTACALWIFLLAAGVSAQTALVDRIVDGDTFTLTSGEKVRLIGIDTPESQDPNKPVEYYSTEAKDQLEQLIGNKQVRLEFGDERTDKYGRLLCYVWVGDTLVNLEMVRQGYAMAYLRFPHSRETEFLKAEIAARRNAIGMWASPRTVQPAANDPGLSEAQQLLNQNGGQSASVKPPPVAPAVQPSSQTGGDETVYITKSGAKYHRGSCNYLRKSKIPISKKDAAARGYGACSKCRP